MDERNFYEIEVVQNGYCVRKLGDDMIAHYMNSWN